MKRRIAMILVIIATSIILTGEPTETGGDSVTPATGTKSSAGGTQTVTPPATGQSAKTETEIDQIIQSELDNINKGTAVTPTTQSTVDTGTTPAMSGQASDGSKFKVYDNYEKAIKASPNSGAIFRLCNLYYRDGLYERAMNLAKSDNARDVRNLYVVALSSRLMGNFDQSIQYYNEILAKYPGFAEAQLGLGIAYKSKGDFQRAVEYLKNYNNVRRDDNVSRQIVLLNSIINGTL